MAHIVDVTATRQRKQVLPECFVDTENDEKWYSDKDYHYQYIGEIVKAFVKE